MTRASDKKSWQHTLRSTPSNQTGGANRYCARLDRTSRQAVVSIGWICGNTWGGCLEIRQFWVEEACRKQGLGTMLLGAAEHEARRRRCRQLILMTFTFQAPEFYAKHGFEVVAVVDNHPRGHKNLLLRKRLGESS